MKMSSGLAGYTFLSEIFSAIVCRGGSGFRMQGSGSGVQDSGFRVQGPGFRIQGSGFKV